jgi:hypothetical protein
MHGQGAERTTVRYHHDNLITRRIGSANALVFARDFENELWILGCLILGACSDPPGRIVKQRLITLSAYTVGVGSR